MALLRKKTKAKKAQLEASAAAAEARRAAQESATAVRDLGQALLTQLKDLELDEKAVEAIAKLKASDAYAQGQERLAQVSKRVSENDNVAAGMDRASKTATAAAAGLGTWLAAGRRGEALGIAPAKRSGAGWFLGLLGVGIGYGIGILTAPREGREMRDQLASRARSNDWDSPVAGIDGDEGMIAPAGDVQLADKVRTRLGEDPRTSELPSLNINVVDGTVVVRGPAPDATDEDAIRDVVGSVDGVREVDLELGPAR
jgi:osmotically-inducible protein OsmY